MADILTETRGRLGLITLNRPAALNALSLDMIEAVSASFRQFTADPAIDAIAFVGAGDRAFCAGGDVRALVAGDPGDAEQLRRKFFAEEYRLNYAINIATKPVIAFVDGITMGGGCGLSMHASHRVATERTVLSMPETVLGFFPDVGATWFLGQLEPSMALYLGMTGTRLRAADLCKLDLTNFYLPSSAVPAAIDALAAAPSLVSDAVDGILKGLSAPPAGDTQISDRYASIDEVFGQDTFDDLLEALVASTAEWSSDARDVFQRACPTSLAVTYRQIRRGRDADIAEALKLEYCLALRLTRRLDFYEGVRAILIDKTNDPQWQPATLHELDPASTAILLSPAENDTEELSLDS
jgi:enoyl-CoA hydratase